MKRLLILLLVLVIGVVGLGFYLGWFRVSTEHTDQKTNIHITVDKDKIQQDEEKARDKLREAGQSIGTGAKKE